MEHTKLAYTYVQNGSPAELYDSAYHEFSENEVRNLTVVLNLFDSCSDSLEVVLTIDGVPCNNQRATLDKTNNWRYTFDHLAKSGDGRKEHRYGIQALAPQDHRIDMWQFGTGMNPVIQLTNTKLGDNPDDYIDVVVSKRWCGGGEIPQTVVFYLVVDSIKTCRYVELSTTSDWKGRFRNLERGRVYSVEEEPLENYVPTLERKVDENVIVDVVNHYLPEGADADLPAGEEDFRKCWSTVPKGASLPKV